MEFFRPLPHFLARPWNGLRRRASTHRWVRRLEAYSSAIAFEQVAIEEGLRAATGIATMVAAALAEVLHALRRLAGSVIAASLGVRSADTRRAAAVVREAGALVEAIERRSAATLPTAPAGEPQGDVDRALRSVTVAAAAYVEAFQARSSLLVHASQ